MLRPRRLSCAGLPPACAAPLFPTEIFAPEGTRPMSRNALLNTLSGLVLVLSVVGMTFASRIVMVRNSWQQKTAKAKKDVLDKRKQVVDSEKQVTAARSE